MPEMTFELKWPDGQQQSYYSPSLVMHDYLTTGASYTVTELLDRSGTALAEASERVRAKFGFACTSAAATSEQLREAASQFPPTSIVQVTAMNPGLETA